MHKQAQSGFRQKIRERQGRLLLWTLLFLVWSATALTALTCLPEAGLQLPFSRGVSHLRPEVPSLDDLPADMPESPVHDSMQLPAARVKEQALIGTSQAESMPAAVTVSPAAHNARAGTGDTTTAATPAAEPPSPNTDLQTEVPPKSIGDQAVLEWLRDHQNEAGYLCPQEFPIDSARTMAARFGNLPLSGQCQPDAGVVEARIEATSLALLVFARYGHDHKHGDYCVTCRKMLRWLVSQQHTDGCVGPGRGAHLRQHAYATLALAETYGLSGDPLLMPKTLKAVEYLLSGRSERGGWAEDYRGPAADCVTTALAVMALKEALMTGLDVDCTAAFTETADFMNRLVTGEPGARAVRFSEIEVAAMGPDGKPLSHHLPICEAAYLVTMLLTRSLDLATDMVREFSAVLRRPRNVPQWNAGSVDMLYWWLGAYAAQQIGGKTWKVWQPAFTRALLDNQRGGTRAEIEAGASRENSDEFGSWDAIDAWCRAYGRVGSSALASITLDLNDRYPKLEQDFAEDPESQD